MRAGWAEAGTADVAGGRRALSTSPAPPVTSIVTRYRPRVLASVLVLAATATAVTGIEDARVVHDVAAHDGEDRADRLEILVRHRLCVEVVLVENHEVGQLTFLDGPELILLAQEPAVAPRVQLQHFLSGDLLVGIDEHMAGIETRRGEVHVEPRIHGSNLHPVRAHAGMDAAVHDHAERWPGVRCHRAV